MRHGFVQHVSRSTTAACHKFSRHHRWGFLVGLEALEDGSATRAPQWQGQCYVGRVDSPYEAEVQKDASAGEPGVDGQIGAAGQLGVGHAVLDQHDPEQRVACLDAALELVRAASRYEQQ